MSILNNISKEDMKILIGNSSSIKDLLSQLGLSVRGSSSYKMLYKFITDNGLDSDLDFLREKSRNLCTSKLHQAVLSKKLSDSDIFIENSSTARHIIKRRIIQEQLLPYKCALCGNEGFWNNQPLSLQLDHVNGVHNDNRLENLRFLCPNCHSQTDTFAGKHNYKELTKIDLSQSKLANNSLEQERWKIIETSSIDFSKFGWVGQLAKLFNISANKAGIYVKLHFPDFYQYKCFKRQ